ncbi:DUF4307 domain-containing protein [Microbacterium sp.]|uniref:DUF4307 domain-containing protein n=1 Tax=Microbacterium sp. TaxID=51671 RepID=UPI00261B7C17|nr:DUF4307 domain-containing protein [Microbacterium sp.]
MTTAAQLDERYGRTRTKRSTWIIVGTLAIIVIVIAGWFTISQSMGAVNADDLGYEVVDEHSVTVNFQVSGRADSAVVCAIEALDEEFGVVGWKIVEVEPDGTHLQRLSATVPTVSAATTGLVNTCWVA